MPSLTRRQSQHNGTNMPDHSPALKRLNRAKGQVEAVGRMIQEKRYCLEIVQQLRAASSALRAVEQEVLKGHLEGCVRQAMQTKDPFTANQKIEEILKLWE